MSDVDNIVSMSDEDLGIEAMRGYFRAVYGRNTKLTRDQIALVVAEAEDDMDAAEWAQLMEDKEQSLGLSDDDGPVIEGEVTEAVTGPSIVALPDVSITGRGMSDTARAIVVALDQSSDVSDQLDAFATAILTSKVKPLWIMDAMVKAIPHDLLRAAPYPDTVAPGMEGNVSANNPDVRKVQRGTRKVNQSFWADHVHDRMSWSSELLTRISNLEKLLSDKDRAIPNRGDREAELQTMQSRRRSRIRGLKIAYKFWYAMQQANEYSATGVQFFYRRTKDKDGVRWMEVLTPASAQDKYDPQNVKALSIGQMTMLDFGEAEAKLAAHKAAGHVEGTDYNPWQILMDTLTRGADNDRKNTQVKLKDFIPTLYGIGNLLDKEDNNNSVWQMLKAGNDDAKDLGEAMLKVYDELSLFVATLRQTGKRVAESAARKAVGG